MSEVYKIDARIADGNGPAKPEIGRKLRQFRLARRQRLKDVAEAAGCSESMLSKIENDKVVPSIGLLHRLVTILGTNVSTLFDQQGQGCVTRAGHRAVMRQSAVEGTDSIALELLTPFPSPNLFQSSIHTVPPNTASDGAVEHDGEDFGYILEGELELRVDGEMHRLGPGDTFYFSSKRPHSYSNPGPLITRVLWFNTPPTF